jgi:DNA-binding NarL/FixJ family response regulator
VAVTEARAVSFVHAEGTMMPRHAAEAVRILCVEDLHFVAEAICDDVNREPGFQSVGMLPTPDRLIDEARRLEPDIVLLDLRTGGADAFATMAELLAVLPQVRVIVVSGDNHPKTIDRAFDLGASGYVVKHDPREVIDAVKTVAAGGAWRPRRRLIR